MYTYLCIAILFFILSPGILLTIPPVQNKIIMSGKTSILSAFIHALLFAFIIYLCDSQELFTSKREIRALWKKTYGKNN